MRTLIGTLLIGTAAVILSGIFFVARPVMAIVRGTAVSPTEPITQTTPGNPNLLPQEWGMGSGWGMPEGNWNRGGMMGRGMMDMDSCDRMEGNWNNANTGPLPGSDTAVPPQDVSFKNDIQPIFNARCVSCHGGTNGLYLTSYEDLMQGGVNGTAVIAGDPNSSRLIGYVSDGYMPLGGPPLSTGQIQTLVNWVAAGAPNN